MLYIICIITGSFPKNQKHMSNCKWEFFFFFSPVSLPNHRRRFTSSPPQSQATVNQMCEALILFINIFRVVNDHELGPTTTNQDQRPRISKDHEYRRTTKSKLHSVRKIPLTVAVTKAVIPIYNYRYQIALHSRWFRRE